MVEEQMLIDAESFLTLWYFGMYISTAHSAAEIGI
jgi:hypothetical protein